MNTENKSKALRLYNRVKLAVVDFSKNEKLKAVFTGPHTLMGVVAASAVSLVVLIIITLSLFGSSKIPSESTIRELISESKEYYDDTYRTTLIHFSVDSCEVIEEDGIELGECTITYQLSHFKEATNHMRHIPASKKKSIKFTEDFKFLENENGEWTMMQY